MKLDVKITPFYVPEKVTINVTGKKNYSVHIGELDPKDLKELSDQWLKDLNKKAADFRADEAKKNAPKEQAEK